MTNRRVSHSLIGASLIAMLLLTGCADYYGHRDRRDDDGRRRDAPYSDRDRQDRPSGDQDHHDNR